MVAIGRPDNVSNTVADRVAEHVAVAFAHILANTQPYLAVLKSATRSARLQQY